MSNKSKKTFSINNPEKKEKEINETVNIINQIMTLNQDTYKKLLPYQVKHVNNLLRSYNNSRILVDASDTGTGKTYASLGFTKIIGRRPFIICPKPVMNSWKKACEFYGIKPYAIINYDTVRNGKILNSNDEKEYTTFIVKRSEKEQQELAENKSQQSNGFKDGDGTMHIKIAAGIQKKTKQQSRYTWNLPRDAILIFDEAHKCKNNGTLNSELLLATKEILNPVLLLSATLIDKPENFLIFGYLLGLSDSVYQVKKYMDSFSGTHTLIMKLHQFVFPNRGARMRISELGSLFPDNMVIADTYTMDPEIEREIEKTYDTVRKAMAELKKKESKDSESILTILLRARQKIEMLKLPTLCDLITEHLENNLSVVVFLNFNETIRLLQQHYKLKPEQLVIGGQKQEERDRAIASFQENKNRLLVCNIQSGGTGISLHDLDGRFPRVSLISPTWSSTSFVQTLGRIHRAGAKSKAIQKIVFCAGTIEEKIAITVRQKINNLSLLNDGELSGLAF